MIKIKDRKRQRLNRRLKHKEELLDKKNDLGVKDLTAYNAVKQMVTNGKASIVWRLTAGKLAVFHYPKESFLYTLNRARD